jgi:hypothetical protein
MDGKRVKEMITNRIGDITMKFRMKVVIMTVAVLLTLVGFNMLVSSSTLDVIHAGKLGGYEITVTAPQG